MLAEVRVGRIGEAIGRWRSGALSCGEAAEVLGMSERSHYFVTPKAGGKVARAQPTQVGRALEQLGIEHIPSYSPEARGRMERVFGTLQNRLPQELRLAVITTPAAANSLPRQAFPGRAQRPLHGRRDRARQRVRGLRGRSRRGFVRFRSNAWSGMTTACATRAAVCRSRRTGTGTTSSRSRYGCTPTRTAGSRSSTARAAWLATSPTAAARMSSATIKPAA